MHAVLAVSEGEHCNTTFRLGRSQKYTSLNFDSWRSQTFQPLYSGPLQWLIPSMNLSSHTGLYSNVQPTCQKNLRYSCCSLCPGVPLSCAGGMVLYTASCEECSRAYFQNKASFSLPPPSSHIPVNSNPINIHLMSVPHWSSASR